MLRQLQEVWGGIVRYFGNGSLSPQRTAKDQRRRGQEKSCIARHGSLRSYFELKPLLCGCRLIFCTRQAVISETSSSFSFRQSISCTVLNSPSCLPACPNLPTIVPSSSIL